MDKRFTAGPWSTRGEDGKYFDEHSWNADNHDAGRTSFVPVHANGTVVALVVRTDWNDEKLDADANLIAAAPELLKALEDLFGADMEYCMRMDGKEDQLEAISNARAAIAKALGDST
ncbi:hypothetical protein FUT88_13235 [Ralstonia sp. TCR112]|uniref:hypothetical protein n=1 Tax=Ralstonia sp. TCR112 TaxID=2601730 RepID=UPI0011BFC802|nr:hypothetical protein [Ralstonia sp. TCR112]TXD58839.1 hypothetical protein FUT88_13235 [Ralstonia sp. TCR112]